MPSNNAAWLTSEKSYPLQIQAAEYVSPSENQVLIKNAAVALNPVDKGRQDLGSALFPWVKYPCILGSDVAGEVTEVGSGVTSVKVGDRVLGLGVGLTSKVLAEAGFQEYTIVKSDLVSKIPSSTSFEAAATIPLAVATAATGLFQKDYLALHHPTAPASPANGKTLLIWGGASSVGTNAIQLAVAAGYEVIATASPRNHEYLKKLGAAQVFDYKSDGVVSDIVQAFRGKDLAGALAIGSAVAETVANIVDKIDGGNKFVACANNTPKNLPEGVGAKFIFGTNLRNNEVGPAIFNHFIPDGLADGTFVPSPPPEVIGKGLESIQGGLDLLNKGVSAKKLVVTL